MKLLTITVTRTVQIRQYEPLVMSATAEVDVMDTPLTAMLHLSNLVCAALRLASGREDVRNVPLPGAHPDDEVPF